MAYRWFLGYRLQEDTPHFSTVSYNFRHRFTSETVDQIFGWILMEMVEAGYVAPGVVFVDGTHIKANANTKKKVFSDGKVLSTAYKQPQTMKGGHPWDAYVYDEHFDCIICPEYQVLNYSTTNRDGYWEYKSDPQVCCNCPTRHLCTKSKDCIKTVTRRIRGNG